jgi:AraC-like DNA-binding protein
MSAMGQERLSVFEAGRDIGGATRHAGQVLASGRYLGAAVHALWERRACVAPLRHRHAAPMLLVPQGATEATVLKDGIPSPFSVDADHFMIVPAHCGHQVHSRGLIFDVLALFPEEDEVIARAPLHAPQIIKLSAWSRAVMQRCVALLKDGQPLGHELEAVALAAIVEDAGHAGSIQPEGLLPRHRLAQAVAIAERELGAGLTVVALADRVGLHPATLLRLFKAKMGMTPQAFIKRRRLEMAQELLKQGEMTVRDVAVAVGYGETSSFSDAFRQAFGVPPTQWQRDLGLLAGRDRAAGRLLTAIGQAPAVGSCRGTRGEVRSPRQGA